MKNLLTLILAFSSITLYSQQAQKVSYVENITEVHSQSAIQQIRNHLIKNIEYPEIMVEDGVEGTLIIEVTINQKGKVIKSKILEGIHYDLDKAALKAIKKVTLKEKNYKGAKKISIPILFEIN